MIGSRNWIKALYTIQAAIELWPVIRARYQIKSRYDSGEISQFREDFRF